MIETRKLTWDEVDRLWRWHEMHQQIPIILDDDNELVSVHDEADCLAYCKKEFPYNE